MAVKKLQSAMDLDPRGGAPTSIVDPSSVDDLLSLSDDELSALMPRTPSSSHTLRRDADASAQVPAASPSPKASGKFVTDGGRRAAPKVVKRIKRRDPTVPNKASGAYAKVVTPATTDRERATPSPVGPAAKLEDFADLVSELESLVDVPRQEQTVLIRHDQLQGRSAEASSAFDPNAKVSPSTQGHTPAELQQPATVPLLSVATLVATLEAAVANKELAPDIARGVTLARPPEANVATATAIPRAPEASVLAARAATIDEARPSPVPAATPAAPVKRGRTVLAAMMAVAALGIVIGATWIARGHARMEAPQISMQTSAPPAAEPSVVVPATVVPVAAQAPAAPEASAEQVQSKPADGAGEDEAKRAKPIATARKAPLATPEAAAATAAAAPTESPKAEPRVAAKAARHGRSPKSADDAKGTAEGKNEVDEETKKALEALQKSQLESSF